MTSHYLIQCWFIANWTLRNKFQWKLNRNFNISIQENVFENVDCKMAAIMSKGWWVKLWSHYLLGLWLFTCSSGQISSHFHDINTWKPSLHYWPFVRRIHRSTKASPLTGPLMLNFNSFFVVGMNNLLNKHSNRRWLIWHSSSITAKYEAWIEMQPYRVQPVREDVRKNIYHSELHELFSSCPSSKLISAMSCTLHEHNHVSTTLGTYL